VVDALARPAAGKTRNDLLWTSRAGGHLSPPHGDQCWLAVAVRRCQESDPTFPSLTAHDLRHTAASLAIHAGANPKVVQRMLGHASAAMTLDVYADLFESDLDAVAENVATTGRGPLICAGHLHRRCSQARYAHMVRLFASASRRGRYCIWCGGGHAHSDLEPGPGPDQDR
jgi:hypothetical protein